MIPMRPCPHCHYPAAYDAFGNTDHVCLTGPGAALFDSILPRNSVQSEHEVPRKIVIESTARGNADDFYTRWRNESAHTFNALHISPWPHNPHQ